MPIPLLDVELKKRGITEGNCFLIKYIDELLITTILNLTKSSLINLSRTQFKFKKEEMEEIRNFNESVNISFSYDIIISSPIIAYMIRRYFYPSFFFKDPSFFIFEPNSPNDEILFLSAFDSCSSLTQIIIPPSVTTIGPFAFYQCQKLVEITIPLNMAYIGYSSFEKCQSLIHLNIPRLKEIQSSTYNNCSSLQEIRIPSSVTSIGKSAFLGCSSLQEITIPSSVTSIGFFSFSTKKH